VSLIEKRLGQMRTDEARTAGDESAHASQSFNRTDPKPGTPA
jgi:hypothetical protein